MTFADRTRAAPYAEQSSVSPANPHPLRPPRPLDLLHRLPRVVPLRAATAPPHHHVARGRRLPPPVVEPDRHHAPPEPSSPAHRALPRRTAVAQVPFVQVGPPQIPAGIEPFPARPALVKRHVRHDDRPPIDPIPNLVLPPPHDPGRPARQTARHRLEPLPLRRPPRALDPRHGLARVVPLPAPAASPEAQIAQPRRVPVRVLDSQRRRPAPEPAAPANKALRRRDAVAQKPLVASRSIHRAEAIKLLPTRQAFRERHARDQDRAVVDPTANLVLTPPHHSAATAPRAPSHPYHRLYRSRALRRDQAEECARPLLPADRPLRVDQDPGAAEPFDDAQPLPLPAAPRAPGSLPPKPTRVQDRLGHFPGFELIQAPLQLRLGRVLHPPTPHEILDPPQVVHGRGSYPRDPPPASPPCPPGSSTPTPPATA